MTAMNKKNIRNLTRALVFVMLFALIFMFLSKVFAASGRSSEDGMERRISMAYKGETRDSLDVVFVGNSDIYRAVSPVDLYKNTGITSAVAGKPNLKITKLPGNIRDILKYQKPKVLVLDTDCMFSSWNPGFKNGSSAESIPSTQDVKPSENGKFTKTLEGLKKATESADSAILSVLNFYFPLIKYHDSWKNLTLQDFLRHSGSFYKFSNKGMAYSDKVKPLSNEYDYMNDPEAKPAKLSADKRSAFDEICRICKDNGIRLVLVTVPSANTWNMRKSRQVQELADRYGLTYYDYNIDYPEGFDWAVHSQDGGNHLNYGGALTVTEDFGEKLRNDLDLDASKLTKEQRAQWEKDYRQFHEQVRK